MPTSGRLVAVVSPDPGVFVTPVLNSHVQSCYRVEFSHTLTWQGSKKKVGRFLQRSYAKDDF